MEQTIYYFIDKYNKSSLYPTLSQLLSARLSDLPVEIVSDTVPANTVKTLAEFTTPFYTLLLSGAWTVYVDLYEENAGGNGNGNGNGNGGPPQGQAKLAVELLKDGVSFLTTDFVNAPTELGRLAFPVYLPDVTDRETVTLRLIGKSVGNHAHTFYVYFHRQYTYMKK